MEYGWRLKDDSEVVGSNQRQIRSSFIISTFFAFRLYQDMKRSIQIIQFLWYSPSWIKPDGSWSEANKQMKSNHPPFPCSKGPRHSQNHPQWSRSLRRPNCAMLPRYPCSASPAGHSLWQGSTYSPWRHRTYADASWSYELPSICIWSRRLRKVPEKKAW